MAETFLKQGVKNVVITLDQRVSFSKTETGNWMKAFKVKVIDTTAAGDAFLGGLAFGLSENKSIREV